MQQSLRLHCSFEDFFVLFSSKFQNFTLTSLIDIVYNIMTIDSAVTFLHGFVYM